MFILSNSFNPIEKGFIAQELYEIYPSAVYKPKKEEDMWGIDYSKLTPILVQAIKDQQIIINELKNRITNLENKLK